MQWHPCGRVLIPQALARLRPGGNLLRLVQDQEACGPAPALSDPKAGRFPLLLEPAPVLKNGFICGGIVPLTFKVREDLAGEGCLSRLAWSCKHLNKTPRLTEPFRDYVIYRAFIHGHPSHNLLNTVSKFTQYVE